MCVYIYIYIYIYKRMFQYNRIIDTYTYSPNMPIIYWLVHLAFLCNTLSGSQTRLLLSVYDLYLVLQNASFIIRPKRDTDYTADEF